MKVLEYSTKQEYNLPVEGRKGNIKLRCPVCDEARSNKTDKSLSFNVDDEVGHCHYCEASFYRQKHKLFQRKVYVVPERKNKTKLSDKALAYFKSRGISEKTLEKTGVYSSFEFMPQTGKEESVICFPYIRDDELVNIKYRDGRKNFKLVRGAEKILYNINALKDHDEIYIVEGEIDALTFIEAGIENVVSVPNGANKNLDYLVIDDLRHHTFVLSVDNDKSGYILRNELLRRLEAEKCKLLDFGVHKDANGFFVAEGKREFLNHLKTAKDAPVDGSITAFDRENEILDLYMNGLKNGHKIDSSLDEIITWETGRLAIVTGVPGNGKSQFVEWLAAKLNIEHEWKVSYFSPERNPMELHFSLIASLLSGKTFSSKYISGPEFAYTFGHISKNFFWVDSDDIYDVDKVLEVAELHVRKYGIRTLVLDPYNCFDHSIGNRSETDYIGLFLDKLRRFAKKHGILVILVAHPRKMRKNDTGNYDVPSLYDISGSSNFFNKADYGICVHLDYVDGNKSQIVQIHIQKVKHLHLGKMGLVKFVYNLVNGRYEEMQGVTVMDQFDDYSVDGHKFNISSWLKLPFENDKKRDKNPIF